MLKLAYFQLPTFLYWDGKLKLILICEPNISSLPSTGRSDGLGSTAGTTHVIRLSSVSVILAAFPPTVTSCQSTNWKIPV